MSIQSVNPVNGEVIKTYKADTGKQILIKIEKAKKASPLWRSTSFKERGALLHNAAAVLRDRKNDLSRLMALEMGKPLKGGLEEIEKCALACTYYAEHGADFLQDETAATEASLSYVNFQPLGTVLAIMPWNFPFWQVFRFLAPGLMAGNCGLLKHASNVPGCALAIQDIMKKAGYPSGVFQTLMVGSREVNKLIAHPDIHAVTLTGSTQAGMEVAQQAGLHLKKTVLELGGSDPYLVLEDADLEEAARVCATSRLINNGQSCIAAKRFIVDRKVEKQFLELFREQMASRITGNPLEETTELGPMARIDLRDALHQQILKNIRKGARCILGGTKPRGSRNHAFYTPTILTGIKKGMSAYEEELFGPVAAVLTARNTEHAIQLANDSDFGLGAAVFTRNKILGEKIARHELQAGSCFVNSFVRSDPRLPFGGIKQSGYGRELGLFGIREFVNIKTVYIK